MKQTKTTLKELTARYRAILLKCALINLMLCSAAGAASISDAADGTNRYIGSFGVPLKMYGNGTNVYFIVRLVDFCGWESDIAKFSQRMNTLLKDVRLTHGCTYQSIQKPLSSSSILRKNYQEWKKYKAPKGDRVFPRQMFIAENLLKLLSISA